MNKIILLTSFLGVTVLLTATLFFLRSKQTPGPILNDCLKTCPDNTVVTCDKDCPILPTPSSTDNTNKGEEECINKGGEWKVAGLALTGRCFIKMKDADKLCSAKKDCEGTCLAPENAKPGEQVIGKCSEYNLTLGCHSAVEGGKVMPALCAD